MENEISQYHGAVFYIDILGMSALTENKLKLNARDFEAWHLDESNYNNHSLAAMIIRKFRDILTNLQNKYKSVCMQQISDCAFVWSETIIDILCFSTDFMFQALKNGILCRSGLASGNIIELKQKDNLDNIILGDAVTSAANLEKVSKGARILINDSFIEDLRKEDEDFSESIERMFVTLINPIDYMEFNEYKWYLCPLISYRIREIKNEKLGDSHKDSILYTKERLVISAYLRYSPKFFWNTENQKGIEHLNATIKFITENNLLDVQHNFEIPKLIGDIDEGEKLLAKSKKTEKNAGKSFTKLVETKEHSKIIANRSEEDVKHWYSEIEKWYVNEETRYFNSKSVKAKNGA